MVVTGDDPAVLAMLHPRLRRFPARGSADPDLCIHFGSVAGDEAHPFGQPGTSTRRIYDAPVGEVAYAEAEDALYIDYADRIRVLCHPSSGRARVSLRIPDDQHRWIATHPLFTLVLVELLKRRGHYSVHAAGLCRDGGRGLLLAGASGVGKSTLTLALLRAGFGFLGDDMSFLEWDGRDVRMLALPDEIDVTPATVRLFPELHHLLEGQLHPGARKQQVLAEEIFPVQFVYECSPGALVFPRLAGTAKSSLHPMEPAEALLELAPNVLLTDRRSSQAHLDALGALVRQTPCYRLESGSELDAIPAMLAELLESNHRIRPSGGL